jgi:hypothetical protein
VTHLALNRLARHAATAALAAAACVPAFAADAPAARHCVLLAAEYESQGGAGNDMLDSLRWNARITRDKLLQRLQAERLVANAVFLDVDDRAATTARANRIREITGCDTVIHMRNVLWSSSMGGAFGFDVIVERRSGEATTTAYARQYRYGLNQATIAAFSYDAFVDAAWADLRQAVALDGDRDGSAIDTAKVRAEYDRLSATWPRNLPEYHLRHILRESELLGIAMVARLHDTNPPDFAQLAADSSDDKASADKGGDIGWYALRQLPADIAAAVRARGGRPGLIGQPIHAEDGWHVVEILGERPSQPPPFADVAERLGANMRWTAVVPAATWNEALKAQ